MNPKMKGMIEIICGPMFAGKTSELIRQVKSYTVANKKCLVIGSKKDNRYTQESYIVTHDNQRSEAMKVESLDEILDIYKQYDVIAIDEGQFFLDISTKADFFANQGKHVIVSALDGDFKREGFGDILSLFPKSESIKKLSAVCVECGNNAHFTARISLDESQELVGGSDEYKPVCRYHYNKLMKQRRKASRSPSPGKKNSLKSH